MALSALVLAACGADVAAEPGPVMQTTEASTAASPTADTAALSDQAIVEYGQLLLQAAINGGDVLEELLARTAQGDFDPACTPAWAHALLALDDADVIADGDTVVVGGVVVPIAFIGSHVQHSGGDCSEPLPRPARNTATGGTNSSSGSGASGSGSATGSGSGSSSGSTAGSTGSGGATAPSTVRGTIKSTLILGSDLRDSWPEGCHSIDDKEILVRDGAGSIVSLGTLVGGPREVEREETDYSLTTVCEWTYQTSGMPSSGILTFEVGPKNHPDKPPEDSKRVNAPISNAPHLEIINCVGCG